MNEGTLKMIYEVPDEPYLPDYRLDNGKEENSGAWSAFKEFLSENKGLMSAEISDPVSFQRGLQTAFALTRLFLNDALEKSE